MLGCQFDPGVTPDYGPNGICSMTDRDGGGGGVSSHLYRGRGSGKGIL